MLTSPAITMCKDAPRVDSRLLAQHLHVQHKNTMELLERHRADFENFGVVPFQTEKPMGTQGGRPERFALLNEDQAFLLLTYSRNTTRVRGLKVSLVEAFGEVRRAAELRRVEYLPSYHLAHDALRGLGRDPAHQRHLHTNVNRLLNRTAGIEAGQRAHAQHSSLAVLAVGQMLAARAAAGARDDRDAYARIKQMLAPLQALAVPTMGSLSC